jgi:hypothetical protein
MFVVMFMLRCEPVLDRFGEAGGAVKAEDAAGAA